MLDINTGSFTKARWFEKLSITQKKLLKLSLRLLREVAEEPNPYFDYSFVVMPAAKAYEGFVKDLVYALNLISKKRYEGRRFRVGKALNPEIARHHPEGFEILYDDLKALCGKETVPKMLWQTWKECRNQVFHYFLNTSQVITLSQARARVDQIITTIQKTSLECNKLTKKP